MIHLPNLLKGALALAFASLLGVSSAGASAPTTTTYQDAVNALLPLGKTIETASVAQLQQATWGAIASGTQANAGNYIHDVLVLRSDRNSIAPNLTAGALVAAGAIASGTVPSNPLLSGTIAGQVTTIDVGLTAATIAAVSKAVIGRMPILVRSTSALSVGALVSANFSGDTDKTNYAIAVGSGVGKSGNDVVGALYAGVSTNVSDLFAFSKAAITSRSSSATPEILASEISLSGALEAGRIALSGSLATYLSTGASVSQKAQIAEGLVRASGSAKTAEIINAVLSHQVLGSEVTLGNVSSFAGIVAGAVAKGISASDEAAAVMELITKTVAGGSFAPSAGQTQVLLDESQKAQVAAAAVRAALITDPQNNTANAATVGVLQTIGSLANPSLFAITVARSATKADNVGQVANAVANYLKASSSLPFATLAPAEYVALSGSMIRAFPKDANQISERVAQLIRPNTPDDNQAARVDYATQLVTMFPNFASSIAVGVSLTDTQYADDMAKAIVSLNTTTKKNAASIAGAVANIVPSEEACEIANSMGGLIHSNVLSINQASSIASAIASGAMVKTVPAELQVVAAQMVAQLMQGFQSGATDPIKVANNNIIVNAVAGVARSVAFVSYRNNVVKTALPNDPDHLSGFANQVAGSAAQAVLLSTLTQSEIDTILLKIAQSIQAVTPSIAGDMAVADAVRNVHDHSSTQYAVNCLTEAETPVTNY